MYNFLLEMHALQAELTGPMAAGKCDEPRSHAVANQADVVLREIIELGSIPIRLLREADKGVNGAVVLRRAFHRIVHARDQIGGKILS